MAGCLQLHGRAAYMNRYAIARLWRDAQTAELW
ncbi:acyl-CoA dehydrogenase family protein [Croceicoccus ponticola]|nr:acyl-CoA dehydrogenase family protein [Croceicoccus ponticola]